jgi:hypothetical protein
VLFAFNDARAGDEEQVAGANVDAVDLEGSWQEKILTAEHAESAEKTTSCYVTARINSDQNHKSVKIHAIWRR